MAVSVAHAILDLSLPKLERRLQGGIEALHVLGVDELLLAAARGLLGLEAEQINRAARGPQVDALGVGARVHIAGEELDHRTRLALGLGQRLLSGALGRDVARDSVRADDLTVGIAQRQLRGRDPRHPSVRERLAFFEADHRLPGRDGPRWSCKAWPACSSENTSKSVFPIRVLGIFEAQPCRQGD